MSGSFTSESLYAMYQKIDDTEYRSIIRFFEENEEHLKTLQIGAYFEVLVAYAESLFEVGSYEKQLGAANIAIEMSVMHNIKIHKGYNIFQQLLFRKAASHYYLREYAQAEHILRELVKICPSEDIYSRFLRRVLRKRLPTYIQRTRAASVLLFFVSAFIILVEIFAVRPFFSVYTMGVETLRNGVFLIGLLVLVGGDGFHYLKTFREVQLFEKKSRKDKLHRLHQRRQQSLVE